MQRYQLLPESIKTGHVLQSRRIRWTVPDYLSMHAQLLAALRTSEQELLTCDYICGKKRSEIPQDIFVMCVLVRACCHLTGHYHLDKDAIEQMLTIIVADNTYLPFGYSIIQKQCVFLLAELGHQVPLGMDPLLVAGRITQDPNFGRL